jgi:hypothetical protein
MVFTKAFRERNGLDVKRILRLVESLREIVQSVHDAGVLLVDLNEMNFLVDDKLDCVYAIDSDSYQTTSFKATAIMPSIRDWSVNPDKFSNMSDWYSFAILAFQMIVGIHPFKGKHPTIKSLEDRMRGNASVFDPGVRIPTSVLYPFEDIPIGYREWMRDLFQDGKRSAPPADPGQPTKRVPKIVKLQPASGITMSTVASFKEATRYFDLKSSWAAYDQDELQYKGVGYKIPACPEAVTLVDGNGTPVTAWIDGGRLHLWDVRAGIPVDVNLNAEAVMSCGEVLVVKSGINLIQVNVTRMGSRLSAFTKVVATVMPLATRLMDGFAVQLIFGVHYLTVLTRPNLSYTVKIPELKGHHVLSGQASGSTVALNVMSPDGDMKQVFVWFNADMTAYTLTTMDCPVDVYPPTLVLESGMVVSVVADGDMVLSKGTTTRHVSSPAVNLGMFLVRHLGGVATFNRSELVHLKMG